MIKPAGNDGGGGTISLALAPTGESGRCARLFWAWLVFRTVFWVCLARLTQPNTSLDLAEMLAWGRQWQMGYPKHPPLPAWIAEAFFQLSGGDVWGPYLAGYLLTAFCLWSAWRLARDVLPPRLALASALCLEGLVFFNYYFPSELNHNVACYACWAGVVLCLFQALRTGKRRWWLGLGVAAGLGLLAKYTIGVLFVPLALFLVATPRGRRTLAGPGPWLAGLLALALFAPHLLWVVQHDFTPIRYATLRTGGEAGWLAHLSRPGYFCLSQGLRLLPVAFVLLPLLSWRRARAAEPEQRWVRHYLLAAVGGPVAILLLLGLLRGIDVRDAWGSPLWTFIGVLLLVLWRDVSVESLDRVRRRFAVVVVGFIVFALVKNCFQQSFTGRPQRSQFPGRQLAREVERCWQARFGCSLPVATGDEWLALNVSCYDPHRPTLHLFSPPGFERTPWCRAADLQRRGGVVLWDAGQFGDDLPELFRAFAPNAVSQPPLVLDYQGLTRLPPARIGVAFVPPAERAGGGSKSGAEQAVRINPPAR